MKSTKRLSLVAANRLAVKALEGNATPAADDLVIASTDETTGSRHFFWLAESKGRVECIEAEVRDDGATLVLVMDRPAGSPEIKGSIGRFISALGSFLAQRAEVVTVPAKAGSVGIQALDALERIGANSDVAALIEEELEARNLDRVE